MTTTYAIPRHSSVVSSPAPTTTDCYVTTGQGAFFLIGPAMISGYNTVISAISGDHLTYQALPLAPTAGDEVVQSVLDAKDQVRFLVGDTDSDDWQLQDEEIAILFQFTLSPFRVAAYAADAIAAKYSRKVDMQMYQELVEKLSQKVKQYRDLAVRLRLEAVMADSIPNAPAISVMAKESFEDDLDRVVPFFYRSMQTEPGTEPVAALEPIAPELSGLRND